MYYGTMDEKKQYLLRIAEEKSAAADRVDLVVEVVKQFDGKVYNCRFDEAIKELSDSEVGLYVTQRYEDIHIVAYSRMPRRSGADNDLMWARSWVWYHGDGPKEPYDARDVFINGKRIDASRMIHLLIEKQKILYDEADKITEDVVNLDSILAEVKELQDALNAKVNSVSYVVRDACGLKNCYIG